MARGDSYQLQGQEGGEVISSGSSGSLGYRWIQVVNDTVLSSLDSNISGGDTDLVGITLPAGLGFGGEIQSVGVTSGVVIAYYK